MSDAVLYELDGTKWIYNAETRLWMCQCRHCLDNPHEAQALSYAELTGKYTVADWRAA